jgi:hypothetical protein
MQHYELLSIVECFDSNRVSNYKQIPMEKFAHKQVNSTIEYDGHKKAFCECHITIVIPIIHAPINTYLQMSKNTTH